jgi:hypothetical protein
VNATITAAGKMIAATLIAGVLFGQTRTDAEKSPDVRPRCSPHGIGRRIVDPLGIVEFRVPRSASMKTAGGVDDYTYTIAYGVAKDRQTLFMDFGPTMGGDLHPEREDSGITWTVTQWDCRSYHGKDWRGIAADGRRSRHVSISPVGFASYRGVTAKAAEYFDKILDTMCCGPGLAKN